jgi:hypothetical protein
MRRVKVTTYGQRGGEGPTRGKTAAIYLVTFPDGTTATKRSFQVHDDHAWAGIYQHEGKWYVAGIRAESADWPGQTVVPAARIIQGRPVAR